MSSISNVQGPAAPPSQAVAAKVPSKPPAEASEKAPEAKKQSPTTDTVHISSSAAAALKQTVATAAQEAKETPAQTAKEAAGGDNQAKRLLAQQAIKKALYA